MAAAFCQIILLLQVLALSEAGYPHIFYGEHFYDLVGKTNDRNTARRPTVLVMYKPECKSSLTVKQLDLDAYIWYVTHDYETSKEYIWYEYREEDDLKMTYKEYMDDCLQALYFKEGSDLSKPTDVWNKNGELADWVWKFLETKVQVKNQRQGSIVVSLSPVSEASPLTHQNEYKIEGGQEISITTFKSYFIDIYDEKTTESFFTSIINDALPETILIEGRSHSKVRSFDELKKAEYDKQKKIEKSARSLADRLILNLKQPLIVPNFTTTGYEKAKMPDELYRGLLKFYNENHAKRREESPRVKELKKNVNVSTQLIRSDQETTAMIELNTEMRQFAVKHMQPILEEWCNCKLKFTVMYGIREYYNTSVLYNHIDKIATHVISVILQISQDLGEDGEDWLLEVTGYDGKRRNIQQGAGEMVKYESAKLIHGRPKGLKGKHYASAFLHFRPVSNWDYKITGPFIISNSRQILEPTDKLYSELTRTKMVFPSHSEL